MVRPLCIHEDDVETDLFIDYRIYQDPFWIQDIVDDDILHNYGCIGFYGQRPVPSLGGGPGYGASADEIWSISIQVLDDIRTNNIDIPIIDVGIASHSRTTMHWRF